VYERTAFANKNLTATLPQLPQNLFKDPYIFEFLDLPEGHSEKDLEKALLGSKKSASPILRQSSTALICL
jgi:predicted nuclease of restriction endonuclease-like (RecB) superfamily